VETVDQCIGQLVAAAERQQAVLVLTADHGNAEQMLDPETGEPHTAHTANPVPFLVASPGVKQLRSGGILADIAPTLLQLMGVEQPSAMTGQSLIMNEREEMA
jgi:2,3-bisphosphoglycerate-independent phosphoglycerate mutase